jgi:hypothetical protein
LRSLYGNAVSRGSYQLRIHFNVQTVDDAVWDSVGLAYPGKVHAFGMDKNHPARPQFEKLRYVDGLLAVNLHARIVNALSV